VHLVLSDSVNEWGDHVKCGHVRDETLNNGYFITLTANYISLINLTNKFLRLFTYNRHLNYWTSKCV